MMTPDIGPIARALDDHQVDHLLVGGASAQLRGAVRPTDDVDSVVAQDPANLERTAAALTDLGACLRVMSEFPGESSMVKVRITPDLLAQGQTQWWTPHGNLDILPYIGAPASRTHADGRSRADPCEVDGATITFDIATTTAVSYAERKWIRGARMGARYGPRRCHASS